MARFTFNEEQENALLKDGFKFRGAQSNGKLFERLNRQEGVIEGRIVTPVGRIMKVKPFIPQSKIIKRFWGLAK